jgi:hypothetical protein
MELLQLLWLYELLWVNKKTLRAGLRVYLSSADIPRNLTANAEGGR